MIYKVIASETITYEYLVEAGSHEDACANWIEQVNDNEDHEVGDREWNTHEVSEVKEEK
jgi:hypothetical protein